MKNASQKQGRKKNEISELDAYQTALHHKQSVGDESGEVKCREDEQEEKKSSPLFVTEVGKREKCSALLQQG